MAILLDLIIIGIILLSTFLGYKKGLIGVAFKIASFIIAVIITLILYKPVSNIIIENTTWDDNIQTTIYNSIAGTNIEEGEKIKAEETNLPNVVVNYINDGIEETIKETKENVAEVVSQNLTKTIIQVITMLAIFIIARIALIFAKVILNAIAELPLIKQFNEVGGILYGILRGGIIIFVLLGVASFVLPIINQTAILAAIDHTFITKFLYNHNIILMLFF